MRTVEQRYPTLYRIMKDLYKPQGFRNVDTEIEKIVARYDPIPNELERALNDESNSKIKSIMLSFSALYNTQSNINIVPLEHLLNVLYLEVVKGISLDRERIANLTKAEVFPGVLLYPVEFLSRDNGQSISEYNNNRNFLRNKMYEICLDKGISCAYYVPVYLPKERNNLLIIVDSKMASMADVYLDVYNVEGYLKYAKGKMGINYERINIDKTHDALVIQHKDNSIASRICLKDNSKQDIEYYKIADNIIKRSKICNIILESQRPSLKARNFFRSKGLDIDRIELLHINERDCRYKSDYDSLKDIVIILYDITGSIEDTIYLLDHHLYYWVLCSFYHVSFSYDAPGDKGKIKSDILPLQRIYKRLPDIIVSIYNNVRYYIDTNKKPVANKIDGISFAMVAAYIYVISKIYESDDKEQARASLEIIKNFTSDNYKSLIESGNITANSILIEHSL